MNYSNPNWANILHDNHFSEFTDIWFQELPQVDKGNYGRGGYSLVSRAQLKLPAGGTETIYIKRQQNYTCFSWRAPFHGIPTLQREFSNWQICQHLGIATYEVLYFATRHEQGNQQAILITRALRALPLNEWLLKNTSTSQRFAVTNAVAKLVRQLHNAGYAHGHLVPAHIFVDDALKVYFIDLEKMHRVYFGRRSFKQDLAKLERHLPRSCTRTDRLRFWREYKVSF